MLSGAWDETFFDVTSLGVVAHLDGSRCLRCLRGGRGAVEDAYVNDLDSLV